MEQQNRFGYLVGASGVHPEENHLAKRYGLLFELPMLMAAIWILLSWWAEKTGHLAVEPTHLYDLVLWGLFVLETSVLSTLCTNTRRYLKGNWLNLVIIVMGGAILLGWDTHFGGLRILRLLAIFALLFHIGSGIRKLLSRNRLGTTLFGSLVVIVMSGIMMAAIDPGIKTPWDGIWWAWVTVTTVGYGDIVPLTHTGRAFGGLIILMGIGLFSLITASFAAFFISKQEGEIISEEHILRQEVKELKSQLSELSSKLDKLLENPNKN